MSDLPQRRAAEPGTPIERTDDWSVLQAVLRGLQADGVEMCGGELLVHGDGRTECLDDPDCSTDPALHVGTVRCADLLTDGCCARSA